MMDKILEVFNTKTGPPISFVSMSRTNSMLPRKTYVPACACYDSVIGQLRTAFPVKHPVIAFALGEFAGLCLMQENNGVPTEVATEAIQIGNERCPTHEKLLDAKSKLRDRTRVCGSI